MDPADIAAGPLHRFRALRSAFLRANMPPKKKQEDIDFSS